MTDKELVQLNESQMIRVVGCLGRASFISTEGQQLMLKVQAMDGQATAESTDRYLHDLGYRLRAIGEEILKVRAEVVDDDLIGEDVLDSVQNMLKEFKEE